MFKSLLNTLPILNGNFTIACKLNNINKNVKSNFYIYVDSGELKPLDLNSSTYKTLAINLQNGKYAFDVKRYNNLTNIYTDTYVFDPLVFKTLNTLQYQTDRNKIFEFGCQRVYSKFNGFEWSFYAPIYINNINDLPDYFVIQIKNKVNGRILKNIKIAIGKRYNHNKLFYYLKRHIEAINENVPITWHYNNNEIILNNCLDCQNGVVTTKIIQATSQLLYDNHVTINEFDSMLSYLYYNVNCIMSEVIPLSFEFNLNDFLEDSEKYYYEFNDFDISGYYEKNGISEDFYIFDTNSHSGKFNYKLFDNKNNTTINKSIDVYNVNNINSLHEGTNNHLKTTNTINKTYCKWCNYDNNNYQINNNVSYSYAYNKYGEYPIFKFNIPSLKLKFKYYNESLNAVIPIYDELYINEYSKDEQYVYNYFINNNISGWFAMLSDEELDNYKNWPSVNKYNQTCFCNGILYHNLPNDIDYFNVLVKLNYIDTDKIIKANIIYDNEFVNASKSTNIHQLYNDNITRITTNEYLTPIEANEKIKDDENYYIYDKEVLNEIYVEFNDNYTEYEEAEVLYTCISYLYKNTIKASQLESLVTTGDFDRFNLEDLYYLNPIQNQYNSVSLISLDTNIDDKPNTQVDIFKKMKFMYLPTVEQIKQAIIKISETRISNISELAVLIDDLRVLDTLNINELSSAIDVLETLRIEYLYDEVVSKYIYQIKLYVKLYLDIYVYNKFKESKKYYYVINNNVSTNIYTKYFDTYETEENKYDVYIDSYNLKKFVGELPSILQAQYEDKFCKFLNYDHLYEYCMQLYTNADMNESSAHDIFNSIYIRRTYINNNLETEFYIAPLSEFIDYNFDDASSSKSPIEYFLNNTTFNNATKLFTSTYVHFGNIDDEKLGAHTDQYTFELFFKKKIIKLTNKLYNDLSTKKSVTDISLDKYCYFYINTKKYDIHYNEISSINKNLFEQKNILDFVVPVFNDVYLNDNFFIDNEIFLKKIINNNFKYNNFINSISLYKKITSLDASTYNGTIYKYANINYATYDGIVVCDGNNNDKFGYILINEYISTNTISYNLDNNIYNNIDFEYVNGQKISEHMFTVLYPFIKNDILLDVIYQLKDIVILPTNTKLRIKYKFAYSNDKKTTQLIYNQLVQYVYLNRYFGNIMPRFIEVKSNIPDMYKEIYKIKDLNFSNKLPDYVSYVADNCNIYNADSIYYIKTYNDLKNENYHKHTNYEIKHFNNNIFYHLPLEITFASKNDLLEKDIEYYERKEVVFEHFKNYVKTHYFNKINEQALLFLFNMYSYICEKNVIKYDLKLKIKVYNIKYKLTLK